MNRGGGGGGGGGQWPVADKRYAIRFFKIGKFFVLFIEFIFWPFRRQRLCVGPGTMTSYNVIASRPT